MTAATGDALMHVNRTSAERNCRTPFSGKSPQ
jgi:hypothetical protein